MGSIPETLKRRADFVAVTRSKKSAAQPGLVLQLRAAKNSAANPSTIRVGYTASKKVGGAVQRNRSKRRLRILARDVLLPNAKQPGDYVLIARSSTASRAFSALAKDLQRAMKRLDTWKDFSKN